MTRPYCKFQDSRVKNENKKYIYIGGPINKFIFGKYLLRIEKVVKIFSTLDKIFTKLVYYCVLLKHRLVKSIYSIRPSLSCF